MTLLTVKHNTNKKIAKTAFFIVLCNIKNILLFQQQQHVAQVAPTVTHATSEQSQSSSNNVGPAPPGSSMKLLLNQQLQNKQLQNQITQLQAMQQKVVEHQAQVMSGFLCRCLQPFHH